jgi:hypothetical protein
MNRTHQPLIAHTPGWHAAVTVGILGWVLDAFDFFDVIFLLTELAAKRANQQRPTVTKSRAPVGPTQASSAISCW